MKVQKIVPVQPSMKGDVFLRIMELNGDNVLEEYAKYSSYMESLENLRELVKNKPFDIIVSQRENKEHVFDIIIGDNSETVRYLLPNLEQKTVAVCGDDMNNICEIMEKPIKDYAKYMRRCKRTLRKLMNK